MNPACKVVTLVFVAFVCFRPCFMCPKICSCKWKHGKQTAECSEKKIARIPDDLNTGTQVIDMSRNSFKEIGSKTFQKKKLVNLQKIYMSENEISFIASDAFFQLSNLVELDLSHNKLQTVPSNTFSLCPNLRRLQLAHNLITILETGAFSSLSHLTYLGLSSCQIEHIKSGALNGLEKLEVIEFDGNRLKTLSIDIFHSLSFLSGLQLHNNPWLCDCKVREVRIWMTKHNIPLSVPPHCESPSYMKGFSWDLLSLENFACVPKILDIPQEVRIISGHNATINCEVNAFPEAEIYWDVAGRSLRNISTTQDLKMKYNIKSEVSESHQSSELTIYNAMKSDNVIYSCVAENKAGASSINFTLTVVCPSYLSGEWSNSQITLIILGVSFIIFLIITIIYLLVYQPVCLTFGSKLNIQCLSPKKQNTTGSNDIRENKGRDFQVIDKQIHHENGSSGYGSDQMTPDLVSKIADMNNGPSLSASTLSCNHLDSNAPALIHGYVSSIDHLHENVKDSNYDPSPQLHSNAYSEIYLNPSYGKDDVYNYALQAAGADQLPDCAVGDKCIPQHDRILTLRGVYDWESCTVPFQEDRYRRYPLVIANTAGHSTFPPKARFLPEKGYAEENLEGTDV